MKTKEVYQYLTKTFREEDWVYPPSFDFSIDKKEYVKPGDMKKSKDLLYSSCSTSDSILFLIQTISKNIILHIQDSNCEAFIYYFQHQLTWMEKGAIQKIFVCHSLEIENVDDYLEYLSLKYQLSKTMYLGKFSKDTWIGLTPSGIFTSTMSKL